MRHCIIRIPQWVEHSVGGTYQGFEKDRNNGASKLNDVLWWEKELKMVNLGFHDFWVIEKILLYINRNKQIRMGTKLEKYWDDAVCANDCSTRRILWFWLTFFVSWALWHAPIKSFSTWYYKWCLHNQLHTATSFYQVAIMKYTHFFPISSLVTSSW